MQLHIVVPVKDLARAKSRLAGHLPPAERRSLVLQMLGQALTTMRACQAQPRDAEPLDDGCTEAWHDPTGREGAITLAAIGAATLCAAPATIAAIWVISADPAVLRMAEQYGAHPLADPTADLNAALDHARAALRRAGADALLVVHGDLPLITPGDIWALADALAAGADVAIAPDRTEIGTNALGCRLDADLPFLFGGASFARHMAAAAWRELHVAIVRSPTLALDVDTPESLARYRSLRKAEVK